MKDKNWHLVTGATGYIGGRLVPELLEMGRRVRVLVRNKSRLEGRFWSQNVDVIKADVLDKESLDAAFEGVNIAYYLIHSMSGGGGVDFHQRDMTAAGNFGSMAKKHNVRQIVYLGGLGSEDQELSHHLKSRHKTGDILRENGVAVTEFRAAVVVGSGSKSFEMIRYLSERVPVMICPKWVYSTIQPIAIRNVLRYLTEAVNMQGNKNKIIQIGGKDILTYADMMKTYAKIKGLHRMLIPIPFLTPKLSSHWIHWMTPIPASLARPLIEGLKNDVVVTDDSAEKHFPAIEPMSYERAVELALQRVDDSEVQTTWSDALISSTADEPVTLETKEGLIIERRQLPVQAKARTVFKTFTGLGGEKGWLVFNWAWKLRGVLDRLVGGVGFRRGRRHPQKLRSGEALDFWRVETVKSNRLLRLRAEMKVPGQAWLEFQAIENSENSTTQLTQTAYFDPKGLFGLLYWYLLYPFHRVIFSKMIVKIKEEAET